VRQGGGRCSRGQPGPGLCLASSRSREGAGERAVPVLEPPLVKPGDHPEFFRFPAPEGRSRESTLRLDASGRFWHDGARVEHAGLSAALHSWIARHPDDGRYILTNGYDWTYFTVDDAPYFVRAVRVEADRVVLALSDGTEETWEPEATRIGEGDALYASVKRAAPGGPFEAKFTTHAQASLAPALVLLEDGERGETPGTPGTEAQRGACAETAGTPAVRLGGRVIPIGRPRTKQTS
jgi:hypothetical protein